MNLQWFVVHTQSQKEQLVLENLKNQEFSVYLPRYEKIRRHARRVDTVLAPLFPRYLFVQMDIDAVDWLTINSTRGVSYILCKEDATPATIPSSVIAELQQQHNENGLVALSALALFQPGEKVRILDGAFKDQVGVYETMTDRQRVQLLLNIIKQKVTVSVPLYAVEKE